MGKLQNNIYRYERKFFMQNMNRNSVESIVLCHPAFFSEIFQERYVNNIYFDFITLNNFLDNINGNTHRTKYRIRWYGEMMTSVENSKLEVKIKDNLVGYKKSLNLLPFYINNEISISKLKAIIKNSEIDTKTKFSLNEQLPIMLNRYRRKYFASEDNKFRITIDDKQSFYKINTLNNTFLQKKTDSENIILELKYDNGYESLASAITNKLPLRITKSSKYSRGIQLLYS